jgi:hypothetical protein
VLADHIAGTATAIWYFSPALTAPMFYAVLVVYPIERIVAFVLTAIVAVPVYYSLKLAGFAELLK